MYVCMYVAKTMSLRINGVPFVVIRREHNKHTAQPTEQNSVTEAMK